MGAQVISRLPVEQSTLLCPLLASVFAEFDKKQIRYCVLRGYEELLDGHIDGDIDLLVAPEQFPHAQRILAQQGFVSLSRWGQSPHRFFIGYDENNDAWIKLDIMTDLAYGRPIPAIRISLASECLDRRARFGPIFVPSVEDEFLALLLHCLLDKSNIETAYQTRLIYLLNQITDERLVTSIFEHKLGPAVRWPVVKELVRQANWSALYKMRIDLASHLTHQDPFGTHWRRFTTPFVRFLDRRTRSFRARGLTVALLAPDGAGKTTLARSLNRAFFVPTRYVYMGTGLNNASFTLPTTRVLTRVKTRHRYFFRALSAVNNLIEQGIRYRIGAYHRWRGRMVIFDRYSSASLLGAQHGSSMLKSVQRWVMQVICPPPDVVVYLDAPAHVLYQRKQEHSVELLEKQRQRYMYILRGISDHAVVDAGRDQEKVRRNVISLIWRRYAAKGTH